MDQRHYFILPIVTGKLKAINEFTAQLPMSPEYFHNLYYNRDQNYYYRPPVVGDLVG